VRLVELARRQGGEVGVSTTPDELLQTLSALQVPLEPARDVVDVYQAVRYGERPYDAPARARIAAALADLARTPRPARQGGLAMRRGGR
jgi:hypothetical protein